MATAIGQMATEVRRMNPWWRPGEDWAAVDPDLSTAVSRGLGYSSGVLDSLMEGGLYLLRGPRRVGKTVAVKQAIAKLLAAGVPASAIVRVAADGWTAKDLRTVVTNAALPRTPHGIRRWWFIDEVSAVQGDWATQIKWLRDNHPDFSRATVVLTGSNASALTRAAGVLAGRRGEIDSADRTLLPIGFSTFARLLQPTLPSASVRLADLRSRTAIDAFADLIPWIDDLVILWEQYLASGGFPVAVAATRNGDAVPAGFVEDMFNVVFRDAFESSQLAESTTMALVERLMAGMAAPLNMTNVAQDVGLSTSTVRRHLAYLRDAYLVWRCPQKEERGWTAREGAQDKIYAIDPLIARLPYLRNSARTDLDLTVLAEMQIGTAVHRAAYASGTPWANEDFLFYFRTPTRKEIDFVGEPLNGAAIEGKYTESGRWAGEAASVNASRWDGILTTRNVLDTEADSAWAVPAAVLAYCLDS